MQISLVGFAIAVRLLRSSTSAFPIHSESRSTMRSIAASTIDSTEEHPVGLSIDSRLSLYQEEAGKIVSSFVPGDFRPVPWLSNRHVQTCIGYLVRDLPECAYIFNGNMLPALQAVARKLTKDGQPRRSSEEKYWDERKRIDTPDGDWFHADFKFVDDSKGLVIILHGLEASSEALLSLDMARVFKQVGMDVVCLNFRGCSGIPANKPGGYHLGFTQDLKHFLSLLEAESSIMPPIFISGFSLGGNVALKALGELGAEAVDRFNIKGAAIACPPIDAEKDIRYIDAEGFNQRIYAGGLCDDIRKKTKEQLKLFCNGDESTNQFDYSGVMKAKTIQEIDNYFIAPIFGFEGSIDYYRKSSCYYYLDRIAVPTYILRAKDDPFLDPNIPYEKCRVHGGAAPIKFQRTSHGGHLGFTFHQMNGDVADVPKTGWMPSELARFVKHVDVISRAA